MSRLVRPRALRGRLATALELLVYVATGDRWWLFPFALVLLAASALLAVVQVLEYVAPFLYTVF